MKERVYLLWFVWERQDLADIELLIGVYASEADAENAISRVRSQKGFVRHPTGFQIHMLKVGEDHWTDGFIED